MKNISIIFISGILLLISCNNQKKPPSEKGASLYEGGDTTYVNKGIGLPFVGKRGFETRPEYSGTGTPHRFVEIKKNGDVFFSFEQENQADKVIIEERFYAGKFKQCMKCFFKKLDNEISYYEVIKDTIYEVNEYGKRLRSSDCCSDDDGTDDKKECTCMGELFSAE